MQKQHEVRAKHERVQAWLQRANLEAVLLSSPSNFAWLTGGGHNYVSLGEAHGVAWLLVTRDRMYLLTNNIERHRLLDEEVFELALEVVEWPWHQPEQARTHLERLVDASRVVSDLGTLGLPMAPRDFNAMRYTFMPGDIARYRALGKDATQALETTCLATRPGETELDVAARLTSACRTRNILPLVALVAADDRIALYRHPLPTQNQVKRALMVVLTGWRHGLHISLTRLGTFGALEPTLESRQRAVMRVDARLMLESKPGVALGQVLRYGMEQYATEGFADAWQLHHQGGLTGYAGREIFATPDSPYRLGAQQALAWNPSITGTKSEDTMLITESGPEILTRTGTWPEEEVTLAVGRIRRPVVQRIP